MSIRLVVGLGNPGERYARTRHNVGFEAVDLFVGRLGASWEVSPVGDGRLARVSAAGAEIWVAKPDTYMNASGEMIAPLARYYRIEPAQVLIVSDDLDLPLGRLRLRAAGSSGGQKGLDSVLTRMGTREVPRLRLGVGPRPAHIEAAAFVLARFGKDEAPAAERMIIRACDALSLVCEKGVSTAMNAVNAASSET